MIPDWFPPCSFVVHDPPTGGVSIDYTVHIHRTLDGLGPEDWLAAEFEATVSEGGLALEHGIVVAPAGEGARRVVPHSLDCVRAADLTRCSPPATMRCRERITNSSRARRPLVVIAVGGLAQPAFARRRDRPGSVPAGSTEPIGFNVEHGCDESATVKVEMQLPEGVTDPKIAQVDGWESAVDGRVITWTGGPQPARRRGCC